MVEPRRFVVTLGSASVLGLAAFLGCAEGAKVEVSPDMLTPAPTLDASNGDNGESESAKVPPKKPPPPLEDENNDAGASSSSTGSSGISSSSSSGSTTSSSGGTSTSSSSSGGVDAGVDSGASSSSSGGTTAACATTSTCTTGTNSYDAGYLSGDTGSDVINLTGSTSHWIKVVVGEDSLSGASLKMTATLTSPPGQNFDLYLHSKSCASPNVQSTNPAGVVDTGKVVIADATFGLPDDQWVLIEVRAAGGTTCDPTAKWTLKLEGNK